MGEEDAPSRAVAARESSLLPLRRGRPAMEVDVDDERFMRRAIELAREPAFTSPNPRVGAVVVTGDEVIGEGSHYGAGHAHAEIVALDGIDATGATCYVTLEPCVHQGRTPPCVPALIEAGISRVVAAVEDPDPRVSGAGFQALRSAGLEVVTGVLAEEATQLNAAYLHQRRTGRPLLTLKLALTLDGRMAAPDGSSMWITGEAARSVVHRRRLEVDAVMVGAGTVVADDPELTVRALHAERQPARIVVDSTGRVAPDAKLFAPDADVLVATTDAASHDRHTAWKEVGAEVLVLPGQGRAVDLGTLVAELARRDWLEVMCEGGAALATSLLRDGHVDRLEIYYGAVVVGRGGPEIADIRISGLDAAPRYRSVSVEAIGNDVRLVYAKEEG